MTSKIDIAKAAFRAYVEDDRAAIEALIADKFRFTSPYDNGIDRKTHFERCWPTHEMIDDMKILRAIESGDEVVVTYEGHAKSGKIFRNTEVLTIRDNKVCEVEVYFGWNVPHPAPQGGFIDPS